MELCTSRHFLLAVFILQIVSLTFRQVFDYLGFMWASVLANFLYTLFVIFGIFGVIQCRARYTISYTASTSVWFFWNLFVICFYANVLQLDQKKDILSFFTGSISWWEMNGPGCKAIFFANKSTTEDPLEAVRADLVTGCVVQYQYVEIIQAGIQAFLAVWGSVFGIKVSHIFLVQSERNSELSHSRKQSSTGLPLYSIEYSSKNYDNDEDVNSSDNPSDGVEDNVGGSARRPMTPRRVKRRSINSRGTLTSTHSRYSNPQLQYVDQPPPPYVRKSMHGTIRYSTRSLSRRQRSGSNQSLEDRRHAVNDSSTSNDSFRVPPYSSNSQLLSPCELLERSSAAVNIGHTNPSYASNVSLERPPSARSNYSNYHGVRTFSYTAQATPQVPSVNAALRHTGRPSSHSTFFDSAPPAYTPDYS